MPDEQSTRTVTFQPDEVAAKLLEKAVADRGNARGARTHLINKSIHTYLRKYAGKRELALLEN